MTSDPTPQDEAANNSDASLGGRIENDHDGHHDRQYDEGCAALPCAVSPCEHNGGASCQHCDGEDHAAGLREPKPLTEPSPIASDSRHARMLGQRDERHLARCGGMTLEPVKSL